MTDDALMSPDEVAKLMGLSRAKVMELRIKQQWPHVRLGKRIRFTRDQYAEIVRRNSTVTTDAMNSNPFGLTPGGKR